MNNSTSAQPQPSVWADENVINNLRMRTKTFYNADYFEHIVLPLLDIPQSGRVLDVGCGHGGLSFTLAGMRPDLLITGVDMDAGSLEDAAKTAAAIGWKNLTFLECDGHDLKYESDWFDAVCCQTVLTHVRDAEQVVHEMARVLKPAGVFMAAEYMDVGEPLYYSSTDVAEKDEEWKLKFFRLCHMMEKGKKAVGRGDDSLGIRIPCLAAEAGLDVFDVRLNDRVLHVIPPYRHPKQQDYLELIRTVFAPGEDSIGLNRVTEIMKAGGGTEEDAAWFFNTEDDEAVRQAIEDRNLTRISAYLLFLVFARKPAVV